VHRYITSPPDRLATITAVYDFDLVSHLDLNMLRKLVTLIFIFNFIKLEPPSAIKLLSSYFSTTQAFLPATSVSQSLLTSFQLLFPRTVTSFESAFDVL
jgi:hypothetical protein